MLCLTLLAGQSSFRRRCCGNDHEIRSPSLEPNLRRHIENGGAAGKKMQNFFPSEHKTKKNLLGHAPSCCCASASAPKLSDPTRPRACPNFSRSTTPNARDTILRAPPPPTATTSTPTRVEGKVLRNESSLPIQVSHTLLSSLRFRVVLLQHRIRMRRWRSRLQLLQL